MKKYIEIAFKEALKAKKHGEVPIGCVIVKNNRIIAKAHNQKEKKKNTTRHAEIIAIEKACIKNGDWRLDEHELYVTLEPCMMCRGAIDESRIKNVYYGLKRDKLNKSKTKYVYDDDCVNDCKKIISDFFKEKRNK